MVEEEADIEETEATWEDDTQTATNVRENLRIEVKYAHLVDHDFKNKFKKY